jgi:hypothetical protein
MAGIVSIEFGAGRAPFRKHHLECSVGHFLHNTGLETIVQTRPASAARSDNSESPSVIVPGTSTATAWSPAPNSQR